MPIVRNLLRTLHPCKYANQVDFSFNKCNVSNIFPIELEPISYNCLLHGNYIAKTIIQAPRIDDEINLAVKLPYKPK